MLTAYKGYKLSLHIFEHKSYLDLIKQNLLGRDLTTFSIGGKIDYLAQPQNSQKLAEFLLELKKSGISYRILGAGSNLLISDSGIRECVIKLGQGFRTLENIEQGRFKVGAAYSLMLLSRQLSELGYSGLEFAGGIPASVGGAVRMNAGAHGSQISDIIERLYIVDHDGTERVLKRSEIEFSYRHSDFNPGSVSIGKDSSKQIVTAVEIKLISGDRSKIAQLREKNLQHRKAAQPLKLPSAGSVFKNPSPDKTAWQLLEELGLKGTVHAGAQISPQHANWIVNPSRQASSEDVRELIELAKRKVKDRFGLELQNEIIFW